MDIRGRQARGGCEHARMAHALEHLVLRHTRRLPAPTGPAGDGAAAARRFDAALMTAGFKLSGELLEPLPALVMDADHAPVTWLSYTALSDVEGTHSGDITEAPDGASEFIDMRLGAVRGCFVVPQVHAFAGEGFDEAAECFFGFMLREPEQRGRPFEPRTVRMKSDLRGAGRVALPLAFRRDEEGRWYAHWLHVYLRGQPAANRVEEHRVSIAVLLRGLLGRSPLTVGHLVALMEESGGRTTLWDGRTVPEGPVTYIALERPVGLAPGSRAVTPEKPRDLIPA
ncbi:hypothetical protein AMK29_16040 [Streptomyces sp. CB02261]|nr:hypothetical protein AMK29_16040 [Streptomyces sp. CB02261]